MKKLLFLVATVVAFSLVSCGTQQAASKKGNQNVRVGAKAGVNFSDITGDDVDSFDGRTSFHVGAIVEVSVSDKFSVQPEILFSSQGSDWSSTYESETFEGSVKVDYLNIPVMAKYYVAEGFSLEVGPQVGLLISAKEEGDGVDGEEDIKDYLKGIDFGLNFGLGYKMESGLNFGARYSMGFTDANDDSEYFQTHSDFKNSVIQISIGYFF